LTARRKNTSYSHGSKVSVSKAIFFIIILSAIALLFVHKEVKIDQKAREVKALQDTTSKLQIDLTETRIEIEKLTSFPRISRKAAELGLLPLTKKPVVINVSTAEIPVEFTRDFALINSDK